MKTKEIETSEKAAPIKTISRPAMSILLVGLTAWLSIPFALAMRGYFAVGGEYFLIVGMGTLPWLSQGIESMLNEAIALYAGEDN